MRNPRTARELEFLVECVEPNETTALLLALGHFLAASAIEELINFQATPIGGGSTNNLPPLTH